ncbi:DUF3352 domain-containing protein [Brasilonema sp. UFV-L1]|uniref:DUF3352 domain-containing protein n=1 Tax=Brasilonema sp. UFV-L1 TaxID=2234130 RepID=UPI00145CA77E|nr:DUF3352 domain-containing protein [Brasilonema sp. UFV-L1]NMG10779.1 DUF3352 domain-containing protein [Brasilonema sp. UFV-L1]
MMQRLFFRVLAASTIMLLLIGLTACNGFAKNPLTRIAPTGQSKAAIFVSKQAPVMGSMLVNPERLQAFERDGELSKIKTSLLANTGIDYQQEIKPWLGNEITLAVTTLDIDHDSENGQQPGYLMALTTTQPEKSREFVKLLFSKRVLAGANLTTEQYKGVKLISDNQIPSTSLQPEDIKNQNSLAGAVVGNSFVLFANHPKVLREAINNVQVFDLNLTSSAKYQKVIQQLPKEAQAVAFLNLPIVAKWQGLKRDAQTYDNQIISLVSNSNGLLAETAFLGNEETLPPIAQLSKPVDALQYIPASASLAVAGANLNSLGDSDLGQLWQQLTAALSTSTEDVTSLFLPLTDVQKRWGINWKEDIFNWVQGEYAIGLLPRQDQTTFDWIFVAEKSEQTPAAISRLDTLASSQGLSLSSFPLDEQKISAWTQLTTAVNTSGEAKDRELFTIEANVLGTRADVGNYEIFASSIEAMDKALTAKDNSLMTNPRFNESIAVIPQPNQGYIYIDWTKSHDILERQLPILKFVEVLGKPFFQNLRSLTMSSYGNDTELLKGGVFFQFNP